jgi:ribosome recycling factor
VHFSNREQRNQQLCLDSRQENIRATKTVIKEQKPNFRYKCKDDISENISRHGNEISADELRQLLTECWDRKEIQTMGIKLISESISR